MHNRICSIPDCGGRQRGQGYCGAHYQKFRKYGDPLGRKLTAIERYEAYTDRTTTPDGCHPWISHLSPSGYGKFYSNGTHWRAHRFGWTYYVGPIPDGLIVRHKVCDNPPCQNVQHMLLGTTKDNSQDRIEHFGHADMRGELHPRAKLTQDDVEQIRASYIRGLVLQADLAAEFGVTSATISSIICRRSWAGAAPGSRSRPAPTPGPNQKLA
jgi:hypothetical protein